MINKKVLLICMCAVLLGGSWTSLPSKKDIIFQVSTLHALQAGGFDGRIPFARLKSLGDFGVGTFDQLDGEMVALDGQFYQVKTDGLARAVHPGEKTPFADITFFEVDQILAVPSGISYNELTDYLLQHISDPDAYYAIRIDGHFSQLILRSVPPQEKPYPTLAEAIAQQITFGYEDMAGTMVGFYMPQSTAGLGIPGFHFHFISEDKTRGGHVLAATIEEAQAALDLSGQELFIVKGGRK